MEYGYIVCVSFKMDLDQKFNFESIEVIDISPFTHNTSIEDKQRVASLIRKVCKQSGFFYITGHGINTQLQ